MITEGTFLRQNPATGHLFQDLGFGFAGDISIIGILSRFGYRPVGIGVAVVVASILLVHIRRAKPPTVDIAGIAICAGILCSPLGWFHYSMFAAPFFATLKRWGAFESVAAVLLALPNIPDDSITLPHGAVLTTLAGLPHLIGACMMLSAFLTKKGRHTELPKEQHAELAAAQNL